MAKKAKVKATKKGGNPAPLPPQGAQLKPLPKGTMRDGIDCSGMTDDPQKEGIPVYLQVQNRKELTPEQKATVDALKKKALDAAYDAKHWDKPKGMSEEEYAAWKNRERQNADAKAAATKKSRVANLEKARGARASKDLPKGTFYLTAWARSEKLDERLVRRSARANKDKLKPLEVQKYVYRDSDKDRVVAIIRKGMEGRKPAPAPKPASKAKTERVEDAGGDAAMARASNKSSKKATPAPRGKVAIGSKDFAGDLAKAAREAAKDQGVLPKRKAKAKKPVARKKK